MGEATSQKSPGGLVAHPLRQTIIDVRRRHLLNGLIDLFPFNDSVGALLFLFLHNDGLAR